MARNYPLEQHYGTMNRGLPRTLAASSTGQFAGRTLIASGSTTVVVSTTAVQSDSIISMSIQVTSISVVTPMAVRAIADGGIFTMGWATGTAAAEDVTIMWQIVGT